MLDAVDRVPLHPGRVQMTPVDGAANLFDMVRADEPSQVGTPINRRALQLLQADRRAYPVTAGQSIQAGDVVDVVDGAVGKTMVSAPNRNQVFENQSTAEMSMCVLSDQYFVAAYDRPRASGQTGIVMCVDYASPNFVWHLATFTINANLAATHIKICRLSDTKFVVVFAQENLLSLYARIGTISSDGAVTMGDYYKLDGATSTYRDVVALSDTKFLTIYNKSGLKAQVSTVSGTTITPGSVVSLSGNTSAAGISVTKLPDLNGSRRVCVCFLDGNNGKASIVSISGADVVTWGAPATFNSAVVNNTGCCADGDDAVVVYLSNFIPYAKVLSISGSTISPSSSACTLGPATASYVKVIKVGSTVVAGYRTSGAPGPGGFVCCLTKKNAVLTKGTAYKLHSSFTEYLSIDSVSETRFVVSFADNGNGNYGTGTILEVFGDKIAGSFEDRSSRAIALQSAAAGQDCEVIFDGAAELPGVTAGQEITSPGVFGYCPEDGRIWVRPEWDATYVKGSYVGTGLYGTGNPTVFDLGFRPTAILILKDAYTSQVAWTNDMLFIAFYPMSQSYLHVVVDIEWTNRGLSLTNLTNASYQFNESAKTYHYIAFH